MTSKIDIVCINHRSPWLFEQQIFHWQQYMRGSWRLVLVDSTPGLIDRSTYELLGETVHVIQPTSSFDGENSGQAYDYAISLCTSEIIGFTDPDHFWLDRDILSKVEATFAEGNVAYGDAGFYDHFQSIFDVANPSHRGELCSVLWGQFMLKSLAASDTWICTYPGVGRITGWKVRERIIDEGMPNIVLPGFYSDFGPHGGITFFGHDQSKATSVHFLKGSGGRSHIMEEIVPPILEREKAKWV